MGSKFVMIAGPSGSGRSAQADGLRQVAEADGKSVVVVDSLTGARLAILDGVEVVIFDPPAGEDWTDTEVRYTAGNSVDSPRVQQF